MTGKVGFCMGRIVIDRDICKGCYLCVDTCPKKLLKKSCESNKSGLFPVEFVDTKKECVGCGMCAMSCPDIAITEVYR